MFDYLSTLRSSSWILDLGSSTGSFDQSITDAHVVRVDLDRKKSLRGGEVVQADAAALPLSDQCIDVVIANHSLEHILALGPALAEIGRIIKPGGTLFVSVPDASTLTDRIYRWLARGGGHVNPFVHRDQLSHLITTRTGLPLGATVDLYSGLSFLNRKNLTQVQRKLWLLGGGYEVILRAVTFCLRHGDRLFGTRLSRYGWAYYFGGDDPGHPAPRTNVCVGCGSGFSAKLLRQRVTCYFYRCPACGSGNLFTDDRS